jgi:hypothetical protein
VTLTPRGHAARAAAIAAIAPELAALGRLVPPAEVAGSLDTLERMRRILDARRP